MTDIYMYGWSVPAVINIVYNVTVYRSKSLTEKDFENEACLAKHSCMDIEG